MNEVTGNVEGLFGLLALAGIVVIVYGPWQWVWTDRYRMEMFAARARLFDLAASGRMSFSSPVYLMMRESLNDGIRFAHRATWTRLLWFGTMAKFMGLKIDPSKLGAAASVVADPDLRSEIEAIIKDAQLALMKSMIIRGPVLWLPILIYLSYMRFFDGSKDRAAGIRGRAFEEYQAVAEGQQSMRRRQDMVSA